MPAQGAKVKTNPKSATAIARAQETPKLIHVRESMEAHETQSGREWVKGQVLTDIKDKEDYFLDLASEQKADETPLSISRKELFDCVVSTTQDTEEGDQLIVDRIHTVHDRNKGTKSIAIVDDTEVVNLAVKLAPALAVDLDEGWKATEKTKYVTAELAFHIEQKLTAEEISNVPEVASKRNTKQQIKGDNKKYNKLYRNKVTGVDRGPPSYIGDIFDRMPDAVGRQLGASILKAMDAIAPVGQEPMGQKAKTEMHKLATQRKNGIKNLEEAFKILQRFALLNEFKHVKATFRVDDAGDPDLQNLKPIKVAEVNGTTIKDNKKIVKANQEWDWYPINAVLNWPIENLPRDSTWKAVTSATKTRVVEIKAMTETPELILETNRSARYLTGSRAEGLRLELSTMVDAIDSRTGLHKNQAWMADVLVILGAYNPLKERIEAAIKHDAAQAVANQKDEETQRKAKNTEILDALAKEKNGNSKSAAA